MELTLSYAVGEDGKRHLTLPDDQRAAVIGFVRTTAKRSSAEIAAAVQQGHDEIHAALAGLSEEDAATKPSLDAWSVLEIMSHVVSVKRIMPALAQSLAGGSWPPGFGPEWEEETRQDGVTVASFTTLAEARAAADAAHAEMLKFIATLDEGEKDTEIRFKHFVFGAFNCREWPTFQRIHDADHGPAIIRTRAAIGAPVA
jgi:hypothetical protein